MSDYPQDLVSTRRLSDGRAVTIRPIRPEDGELVQGFVRHLSDESRYSRFMAQLHELSASKLRYFTQIDYDRHLALIAVAVQADREVEIAVARYADLQPSDTCEFAIAVDDAWHGSGAVSYTHLDVYKRQVDLLAQTETARSTDTVLRIVGDEVLYNDGSKVSDLFGNNVRAPDGKRWTPYQFFINDYALGKRWPTQFIITQPDGTTVGVRFEVRVAGRERITLPAGTFDSYRIEARGFDLASGAQLERTAWVAPERLRGVLAMESLSRKGGTVVSGERVELTDYAAGVPPVIPAAKPSAPAEEKQDGRRWPFSY